MLALSATCDVLGCESVVRFAAVPPDRGWDDPSVSAEPLPDGRWHFCAEWIWTDLPDGWSFAIHNEMRPESQRSAWAAPGMAPTGRSRIEVRCPDHREA